MKLHVSIISCIVLIFLNGLTAELLRSCTYALHLFNDGPVTLDVPVLISAFLECADEEEDYLYTFEDDNGRKINVPGHQTAGATFLFSRRSGTRIVRVITYLLYPEPVRVASAKTVIEVHEYIPGKIELSGAVIDKDGQEYVAAGKDVNMSLEIYYPKRVFRDAEFSYSWTVGKSRYTRRDPFLIHQFSNAGLQWIRAAVVARIPSYNKMNLTRYKWGYFDTQINVKYPFANINISGNTYLHHGELLDLDISCNGSGPVDYCWKVLPISNNYTNLTCSEPVTATKCSFPIIYYFQESGDYQLAIYIDNVVTSRQRNIKIHIYDVSLRPQLSTIIIPMVCTLLVLFIVVGAAVAHIRRKRSYDVETADFDFMITDEKGAVIIETSWENMRRSFMQLLRIPYIYYTTEVKKGNYGTIIPQRYQ